MCVQLAITDKVRRGGGAGRIINIPKVGKGDGCDFARELFQPEVTRIKPKSPQGQTSSKRSSVKIQSLVVVMVRGILKELMCIRGGRGGA